MIDKVPVVDLWLIQPQLLLQSFNLGQQLINLNL